VNIYVDNKLTLNTLLQILSKIELYKKKHLNN